jgi:hypothetical protein
MCHTNRIGPSCVTTFVNATAAALPESPSTPRSAAALIPPALAGGAVALALGTYAALAALWLTSALWFFTTVDFPALP